MTGFWVGLLAVTSLLLIAFGFSKIVRKIDLTVPCDFVPVRTPITITFQGVLNRDFPELSAAVRDAARLINELSSTEIFSSVGDRFVHGDVFHVLLGSGGHWNSHDASYVVARPSIGTIFVDPSRVGEDIEDDELCFWAAHALGHMIGLEHDSFVGSFMNPKFNSKRLTMSAENGEFLHSVYGNLR